MRAAAHPVWPAELRERALRLYQELGPSEASRQTGVPKQTIASWGRRSGVHTNAPTQQTAAAVEAARATREQRVARLAENLLSDAEKLRGFLWEPVTLTTLSGELFKREYPAFKDQKDLLLAVAIAVDKSQLLAGHATARVETIEPEQVATIDKIVELRRSA